MDEEGIEYYFVYMTGLARKDGGYRNAVNSAKINEKEDFMYQMFGIVTTSQETIDYWGED